MTKLKKKKAMKLKYRLSIYLLGVVIGWLLSFSLIKNINDGYKLQTTYRDVAFCTFVSLSSWINVVVVSIFIIGDLEFWDTPINQSEDDTRFRKFKYYNKKDKIESVY